MVTLRSFARCRFQVWFSFAGKNQNNNNKNQGARHTGSDTRFLPSLDNSCSKMSTVILVAEFYFNKNWMKKISCSKPPISVISCWVKILILTFPWVYFGSSDANEMRLQPPLSTEERASSDSYRHLKKQIQQ